MITPQILFFALSGGILPAAFWLWFWLKEDTLHPEPRGLILLTFFGGILSALVSLLLQYLIVNTKTAAIAQALSIPILTLFALIEESAKFCAAYFLALNKKANDEPVDSLVYLISTALGFAAIENTLFLIRPLMSGQIAESIITGNLRFIGATLLHTATSGLIGLFLAISFYRSRRLKKIFLLISIIFATTLHTLFNLFIIQGNNAFLVFSSVWVAIVLLLVAFEKVKNIRPYPIQ